MQEMITDIVFWVTMIIVVYMLNPFSKKSNSNKESARTTSDGSGKYYGDAEGHDSGGSGGDGGG